MTRGLKFRIEVVERLYYPCSENKNADQLCGYREADLRLCFLIGKMPVSHDAAHIKQILIYWTHTFSNLEVFNGKFSFVYSTFDRGARWPSGRNSDS